MHLLALVTTVIMTKNIYLTVKICAVLPGLEAYLDLRIQKMLSGYFYQTL